MPKIQVPHPETGDIVEVALPDDHDGSRVKIEFPDGVTTYTEGFDPADLALSGERPVVPCGKCGAPQTLTQASFTCSACGAHNVIELRASIDEATTEEASAG